VPIDDPSQFFGRVKPLESITNSLWQIRAGNPRHIAITGERGVGKSSFLNQVLKIAEGDTQLLDRYGIPYEKDRLFNFHTVRIQAIYSYDVPDLCHAFKSRLQSTIEKLAETAKNLVSGIDLKILEVNFETFRKQPIGIENAFADFVASAFKKWGGSDAMGTLAFPSLCVDRQARCSGCKRNTSLSEERSPRFPSELLMFAKL
jgi:hypothetical protein